MKNIMLPSTQHYLVRRKISYVTYFKISKWLKKYYYDLITPLKTIKIQWILDKVDNDR